MLASLDRLSDRSAVLAEALARVALGDRAAFATLYRASSAHLFGVILRINPDRAQAEDILQEVFVTIWRVAQSFDAARSQPMTWLTSIARNRAIDSRRRHKTTVQTVSSFAVSGEHEEDVDLLADMPSADPGPLELLQQAAQAQDLARCIEKLTAEQQQCMALTYYQGLSHAEVAQHLAQPLGTVKSWLRRALGALKDCLDRHPAAKAHEA
jgi:RNA polymerase sigma-70 factor (ECF subfamily)